MIYTFGNILPHAVGFLLLPVYSRYLAPDEYGIVSSMTVLTTLFAVFFSLCMERSIYRLYFDYDDKQSKKDYLGTIFTSTIINSIVLMLLIFFLRKYVGNIFKSIEFSPYYVYAILICFFSLFANIPRIYYQVEERAKKFVMLSVGQFLLTTVIVIIFVCYLRKGAVGQLEAVLLSWVIMLPVYLVVTFKITNFTIKKHILVNVLTYSFPLIPTIAASWAINMSNRIFIERYFDMSEVGIYSLGAKLATVGLILISGFDMAYSPYFFRKANEAGDQTNSKKILERSNNLYIAVMLTLVFVIALFSRELVVLLIDHKYIKAYMITRLILLAYFFLGLSGIVSRSLLQHKKTKQTMYIALIMAAFNVVMNFILIPIFGMYGAAYSTCMTFMIGFTIQYIYSKKCYFLQIYWQKFIPIVIFLSSFILIYQFILEKYFVPAFISKIVLVFLLIYLTMRLLKIKGFKDLQLERILESV
ncbi:lipopolysaccharide biosynthesis protein [Elusimicrobiota bacterium]